MVKAVSWSDDADVVIRTVCAAKYSRAQAPADALDQVWIAASMMHQQHSHMGLKKAFKAIVTSLKR